MLEPAVISGDPVLAEHLVANLVDNAVRYNIAGGDIWISTRTAAGSSQLTVAITGPVISPADAGRIFQPFQPAPTAACPSRSPSPRPAPRPRAPAFRPPNDQAFHAGGGGAAVRP